MPWPSLDPQHELPNRKHHGGLRSVHVPSERFMSIISNYIINMAGYHDKFCLDEIKANTMGSHPTTCVYYLMVLEPRHLLCSREIACSDSLTNRAQSSSDFCKG